MQHGFAEMTRMALWEVVKFDTYMYSYMRIAFEEQMTA